MHRLIAHLLPALSPRLAFGRFTPAWAAGVAAHGPEAVTAPSASATAVAMPPTPAAGVPTAVAARAVEATADELPPGCGWYQSSHDLRQGMAVQEWPAVVVLAEGDAAAWRAAAGGWPGSARLQ